MAKKTIKDLKIRDTIWQYYGRNNPIERKIDELSIKTVKWGSSYDHYDLEEGDETRHVFKSNRHKDTFYLNKIDALKAQRKALDAEMESIFKKQQDFYKEISGTNDSIRKCDEIIASELLKPQE